MHIPEDEPRHIEISAGVGQPENDDLAAVPDCGPGGLERRAVPARGLDDELRP